MTPLDRAGGCVLCERDWEHCHGVLLVHDDGELECVGEECVGAHTYHDLTAECVEITVECACRGTRAAARTG